MNAIKTTDRHLQQAALARLLRIAQRDTGQSKRVADFLLAWWNAHQCGGFDLTDIFAVDDEIAEDMLTVMRLIKEVRVYPDSIGLAAPFREMIRDWRPRLLREQAV